MRYEPAVKGDGGEARSRQSAELDIWEDEGGTPLGRVPRYPGRQVDSTLDWIVERHGHELAG